MRWILWLVAVAALAGCEDDDTSDHIGPEEGDRLARQLSQDPPEDDEGRAAVDPGCDASAESHVCAARA